MPTRSPQRTVHVRQGAKFAEFAKAIVASLGALRVLALPARPLTTTLCLLTLVVAAWSADAPTPYPDVKQDAAWPGKGPIRTFPYMRDNRAYFWSQRTKDQGAVVFVGDSLTGGWKGLGAAFAKLKIANRGVGGDTSRGILFRFQEDVVDLHPRAVVITAGANDISAKGRNEDVIHNLGLMLDQLRKADPNVPVVLCTVPLMEVPGSPDTPGVRLDLRDRVIAFAKGKDHVAVLDLIPVLATPDGKFDPANYGADHVHPIAAGYAKWAAALAPVFAQLHIE